MVIAVVAFVTAPAGLAAANPRDAITDQPVVTAQARSGSHASGILPSCTLTSYATVVAGRPFQIRWTTRDAPTTAVLKQGDSVLPVKDAPQSGSAAVTAPAAAGKYTYRMEVSNAAGAQSCQTVVDAVQPVAMAARSHAFVWTGLVDDDHGNDPEELAYDENQLKYIASHYGLVVLNKVHGNWNINQRHLDAQRLKAFNPSLIVLSYFGMHYRFLKDQFGTPKHPPLFQPPELDRKTPRQPVDWRLMDSAQEPIAFERKKGTRTGWWVNIALPEYRSWALETFATWFAAAPYDGIAFDNAKWIPDSCAGSPPKQHCTAGNLRQRTLSKASVDALNDGEERLLDATRQVGGQRRLVAYNGVAQRRNAGDRDLKLLDHADMALNEFFCIAQNRHRNIRSRPELKRDIDLMLAVGARGRTILATTKGSRAHFERPAEKSRVTRFCYGAFLMGYVSQRHYFMFKEANMGINQWSVYDNVKEFALDLGEPRSEYRPSDATWQRQFEHGMVYVNPDQEPHAIRLPRALRLMNGNVQGPVYPAGAQVTIPGQDAFFFVDRL
jgi:hypothetical protein